MAGSRGSLKRRIVGHGEEPVGDFLFNPNNWRFHPIEQRRALQGLLREVGIIQEVIVNKTTGNLVDGHLRVLIADEEGEQTVPVTYVELAPEEELKILISKDRIGGLAATDKEKARDVLAEVLDEIGVEDADLRSVLMDFHEEVTEEEEVADSDEDEDDETGPPDMELQPQEHYDYIIVLARNVSDWESVCEKLGIEKVNSSHIPGKRRIGLGRAVSAERLLKVIDAAP